MHNRIDIPHLKDAMARLPLVSADLAGIGGAIKKVPEHFQVEEVLPYAPSGQGEHLFVSLRRKSWNTVDVARAIAEAFHLKLVDVGWGGRKDKHAITTQTFSMPLPLSADISRVRAQLDSLPFDILQIRRHNHKLRTGHVAANRFAVVIADVTPDAMPRAAAIANRLKVQGLPNYFGSQRFGHGMGNLDEAAALLEAGRKARGRKNAFLVSALQGALFNLWLKTRMDSGHYGTIIAGDIAQKTDTGGMFTVEAPAEAGRRFADHAIVYTGPIFGFKMKRAAAAAGAAEDRILDRCGLALADFKPFKAPGSRRAAVIYPQDLTIAPHDDGLMLHFTLPSGAYATNLLREFCKS